MSDAPLDLPDRAVGTSNGLQEPVGIPLGQVRDLFVTFGKALKAVQLYDVNNPTYQRFVASLADEFRRLWAEVDRLQVCVEEDRMTVEGEDVHRGETRADSLAWLFFKDGIREFTFLPGIEEKELETFLLTLQRARRARGGEGDDLITLFWEADLQSFRYQYVDVGVEGVAVPSAGEGNTEEEMANVLRQEAAALPTAAEIVEGEEAEDGKESGSSGLATVSREDFNPTLYALDPREMEQLRTELRLEMDRDLRGDVLSALVDRLEEPANPERQSEILAILRTLLPNFLSRGALEAAARVLRELTEVERSEGVLDEERRRQIGIVLNEASTPDALQELVRALEDGSISPSPAELAELLRHLRTTALPVLLRASELTSSKTLQPVLRDGVLVMVERSPGTVVELLRHTDPIVAAGAARLGGRMQIPDAAPVLAELIHHPDPEVRLAAIEAAVDLRASTAASALQDALLDTDREVRIAAARALGKLRYRPAARRFRDMVTSKEMRGADLSEKIAFFESYGDLGDDDAVDLLDKFLNGRGFLGRREPAEMRACAALALGRVGSAGAQKALRAAAGDDDPVVRSAVNRALRGEEDGS